MKNILPNLPQKQKQISVSFRNKFNLKRKEEVKYFIL